MIPQGWLFWALLPVALAAYAAVGVVLGCVWSYRAEKWKIKHEASGCKPHPHFRCDCESATAAGFMAGISDLAPVLWPLLLLARVAWAFLRCVIAAPLIYVENKISSLYGRIRHLARDEGKDFSSHPEIKPAEGSLKDAIHASVDVVKKDLAESLGIKGQDSACSKDPLQRVCPTLAESFPLGGECVCDCCRTLCVNKGGYHMWRLSYQQPEGVFVTTRILCPGCVEQCYGYHVRWTSVPGGDGVMKL